MIFIKTQSIEVILTFLLITFGNLSISLQLINITTTPEISINYCPEDCQCVVLKGESLRNHAKCTSINGLLSALQIYPNDTSTLSIHSIDLSHLSLSRIAQHLEKLRDLINVDLSYNELSEIGRLGRRIKKLNLTHNRITSGKLSKIPKHIQHLDLSYNELTYLPLEMTKLSKLQSIELSHNQINCSCQTLEVRNWLQEKRVFSENPIICMHPINAKGKSWLQIRKSEICNQEKSQEQTQQQQTDASENELMLGDQPFGDEEEEEDELGKDFMPVADETIKSSLSPDTMNEVEDTDGSGDLSLPNMPIKYQTTEGPIKNQTENIFTTEDKEDGSGSGMGPLIIPKIKLNNDSDDDNDDDEENKSNEENNSLTDIFGNGLGIVEFNEDKTEENEIIHSTIGSITNHEIHLMAPKIDETLDNSDEKDDNSSEIGKACISVDEKTADTKATYYLLGIIILVLVALILFVAIKRCKAENPHNYDIENPRSMELLDMDKKNLGKPLQKNGTEHVPLIGEKKKEDFAKVVNGTNGTKRSAYESQDIKDGQTQQPLFMNGDKKTHSIPDHEESNNNNNNLTKPKVIETIHIPEYYDPNHRIIPRYPPPKSPRASKYSQSGGDDSTFSPSSPRSGRYSPVYSPETGRVKIKLTETPKPKTPMLVTRSKSNAGDIITTPINQNQNNSSCLNTSEIYKSHESQ